MILKNTTAQNPTTDVMFVEIVDQAGNSSQFATTAVVTSVAASVSSVTLLAANTGRRGGTFYNDSSATLYLKFGASASSTDFTVPLIAGAYYEMPWPVYTGLVAGVWASATGAARVTELS